MGIRIVWGRSIGWNMSFNGFHKLAPPGHKWEKMKITQLVTDGPDCYPWTKRYAWFPVRTVSGKYVWRQPVYKRKVWVVWGSGFHTEPHVQYATDFDLIAGRADLVGKDGLH